MTETTGGRGALRGGPRGAGVKRYTDYVVCSSGVCLVAPGPEGKLLDDLAPDEVAALESQGQRVMDRKREVLESFGARKINGRGWVSPFTSYMATWIYEIPRENIPRADEAGLFWQEINV